MYVADPTISQYIVQVCTLLDGYGNRSWLSWVEEFQLMPNTRAVIKQEVLLANTRAWEERKQQIEKTQRQDLKKRRQEEGKWPSKAVLDDNNNMEMVASEGGSAGIAKMTRSGKGKGKSGGKMKIDPDEVPADGIQVCRIFVGDLPVINNHL
jgi:hypothetical protein